MPELHDDARGGRMVVAAGQERRARWRAEGRRVKLRVAEAVLGQPVKGLRGNRDRQTGWWQKSPRHPSGSPGCWEHPWAPRLRAGSRAWTPLALPRNPPTERLLRAAAEREPLGERTTSRPVAAPGLPAAGTAKCHANGVLTSISNSQRFFLCFFIVRSSNFGLNFSGLLFHQRLGRRDLDE